MSTMSLNHISETLGDSAIVCVFVLDETGRVGNWGRWQRGFELVACGFVLDKFGQADETAKRLRANEDEDAAPYLTLGRST